MTRAEDARVWVVIGPSGSGKSTLGARLAERLGAPFIEADELHPAANVEKMASGRPLDDADRWPWLHAVARAIAQARATSAEVVVACSALKRSYRELLVRESGGPLVFVYAPVDPTELAARLAGRTGHFMPASLLASQIAAFEPPGPGEDAIVLPAGLGPDALVEHFLQAAKA